MTQHESDVFPANRRNTTALRRVANLAAHLVGGAGLAFGTIDALAKRRKKSADDGSDSDREARREERRNARRAERDDADKDDKRQARQERREAREEDNGKDHHARNGSVDQEQRSNKNKDDEPNNNDGNNDDGGDNGRGNAGSGFFDSPLARKTQRRAKDFDNNRGRDDKDDHLTANTDDDGHHFETNSISFTNGPDGLEVITRNIEYSAPPTPTPTPFPTLTLPERDRLDVFGDRVIAAPTAVPTDDGASSGSAPPPSTNTGSNVSTGSRPTQTPPSGDTSGGDNTSDFLS